MRIKLNLFLAFVFALVNINAFSQGGMNDKDPTSNSNPLKQFDLNMNTPRMDLQNFDILKQIEPTAFDSDKIPRPSNYNASRLLRN